MFNKNDNFGKTMVKNFESRGIPLLSIDDFESLDQIKNHFLKNNYDCEIQTMKDLYYDVINKNLVQKINKLEWIDEYEEFNLICSHYFVSIATHSLDDNKEIKGMGFHLLN